MSSVSYQSYQAGNQPAFAVRTEEIRFASSESECDLWDQTMHVLLTAILLGGGIVMGWFVVRPQTLMPAWQMLLMSGLGFGGGYLDAFARAYTEGRPLDIDTILQCGCMFTTAAVVAKLRSIRDEGRSH